MKKLLSAVFGGLLALSCQSDDQNAQAPDIDKYYIGYMIFDASTYPNPNAESDNLVDLTYENGKLVKRSGGILSASPNSGAGGVFNEFVYETVTYASDEILTQKFYNGPGGATYAPNHQKMKLGPGGRMIWKTSYVENQPEWAIDTTWFTYDDTRVVKTQYKRGMHETVADYYYNGQSNLDSIVAHDFHGGIYVGYKRVLRFENYDNSPNPLKHMWLFDDTYFRSLSQNNFTKYSHWGYVDDTGEAFPIMHLIEYDIPHVDGEVRYDLFD